MPPGRQNLSEAALFAVSQPGMLAPGPAVGLRPRARSTSSSAQAHPNAVCILPGVVRPQLPRLDPAGLAPTRWSSR